LRGFHWNIPVLSRTSPFTQFEFRGAILAHNGQIEANFEEFLANLGLTRPDLANNSEILADSGSGKLEVRIQVMESSYGWRIQAYKHASIQTFKHISMQAFKHTSIQAFKHTSIQPFMRTE